MSNWTISIHFILFIQKKNWPTKNQSKNHPKYLLQAKPSDAPAFFSSFFKWSKLETKWLVRGAVRRHFSTSGCSQRPESGNGQPLYIANCWCQFAPKQVQSHSWHVTYFWKWRSVMISGCCTGNVLHSMSFSYKKQTAVLLLTVSHSKFVGRSVRWEPIEILIWLIETRARYVPRSGRDVSNFGAGFQWLDTGECVWIVLLPIWNTWYYI